MRVGIVSNWCNRGQGVVSRYLRGIFQEAGHETFVLARPHHPNPAVAQLIDERDVWRVPNLTRGSGSELKRREYLRWAEKNRIEVMFCDMNTQFKKVAAVRELGVRTIGRFVWEHLAVEQAEKLKRAYDVVYSLHRAEQERYRSEFGIESPLLRFGVPPDLGGLAAPKRDDAITFIFHGGLQGPRKPLRLVVEAFKKVENPAIRLIIKSQAVRSDSEEVEITDDPRIQQIVEDMPHRAYHALFSSCHVCLAPSRWEGLGVHLFEALGYGMPTIASDIPPVDEVIRHGRSGLLVKSRQVGARPNGLPIYDPDPDHLAHCIEELADPSRLAELEAGTREEARRFDWSRTRSDYLALLNQGLTGR
jgi:glycosyltransferase involved in cell wall biosynthesis